VELMKLHEDKCPIGYMQIYWENYCIFEGNFIILFLYLYGEISGKLLVTRTSIFFYSEEVCY
jgi:hypothetical protein